MKKLVFTRHLGSHATLLPKGGVVWHSKKLKNHREGDYWVPEFQTYQTSVYWAFNVQLSYHKDSLLTTTRFISVLILTAPPTLSAVQKYFPESSGTSWVIIKVPSARIVARWLVNSAYSRLQDTWRVWSPSALQFASRMSPVDYGKRVLYGSLGVQRCAVLVSRLEQIWRMRWYLKGHCHGCFDVFRS